jgi:hypothetical protein
VPVAARRLAFSLDLLIGAGSKEQPLAVCDAGHLVVRGDTHWQPERLSFDFRSLLCREVTHQQPDSPR